MGILPIPEQIKYVKTGLVTVSGSYTIPAAGSFLGNVASESIDHGLNYRPTLLIYATTTDGGNTTQEPVASGSLLVTSNAKMTSDGAVLLYHYFGVDTTSITFDIVVDGFSTAGRTETISQTYRYYLLREPAT